MKGQGLGRTVATNRRKFLRRTAAGLLAPTIVPARVFAKDNRPAPSNRLVVGLVGVGGHGASFHLRDHLLPNAAVEVAALCDVDRRHLEAGARLCREAGKHPVALCKDFRDLCDRSDIDAVIVATPDHWHALVSLYAIEAGKDVYCEKPLAYSIDEGRRLVDAARRYGAVVQTGSMQRSDARFRRVCEWVRNGAIGQLQRIDAYVGSVKPGEWRPVAPPPPELDWNLWLGPAPLVPYSDNRGHYRFRWFADYSAGKLTDWGAHYLDIAQWALGMDDTGPVSITGSGEFGAGPHDVPLRFDIEYRYASGDRLFCHSAKCRVPTGYVQAADSSASTPVFKNSHLRDHGILFTGVRDWIFVDRDAIIASDPDLLTSHASPGPVRLPASRDHHEDWFEAIRQRSRPICDVEIGHRSATLCHLGHIAVRLGRPLQWDPLAERFPNDPQANRLFSRPMRAPWHL